MKTSSIGVDLDVERLAEFFDGSLDDVRRFLADVWLPDVARTLQQFVLEADRGRTLRLLFLCDHLRESARTVGMRALMHTADILEEAIGRDERGAARKLASDTILTVCSIAVQLPVRAA
jgi:hypothetical protein